MNHEISITPQTNHDLHGMDVLFHVWNLNVHLTARLFTHTRYDGMAFNPNNPPEFADISICMRHDYFMTDLRSFNSCDKLNLTGYYYDAWYSISKELEPILATKGSEGVFEWLEEFYTKHITPKIMQYETRTNYEI